MTRVWCFLAALPVLFTNSPSALAQSAPVATFNTRLIEVVPFTMGLKTLPASIATLVPFGATFLHDAIAETAKRSANREGRRSAVVVLTDGEDTASRLRASEVSAIASAID